MSKAKVELLILKGFIKPIPNLDELSEETLQLLLKDYDNECLSSINETICNGIVNVFSNMLGKRRSCGEYEDRVVGKQDFYAT